MHSNKHTQPALTALLGKPYPDPFLLAAWKLGVAPETCLVFEDGLPGVQAAEAAGMHWIRVDEIPAKVSGWPLH
jgi:HAD superfamily hydrolase (TIGR01509 family)